MVRPEMVDAAQRFLNAPRVRCTPVEEQKRFLRGKGLIEEEIEAALMNPSESIMGYESSSRQTSHSVLFHQITIIVAALAGISYAGYKIWCSWILPRFFGKEDPKEEKRRRLDAQITELQCSMKFLMDRTTRLLQVVNEKSERSYARILPAGNEMKSLQNDLAIIKSLLLSQNPLAHNMAKRVETIPGWQSQKRNDELFDEDELKSKSVD